MNDMCGVLFYFRLISGNDKPALLAADVEAARQI